MIIRQGIAADYPQLLDIWLRAVRATHHFLQPSDIDALLPQLRDVYFPAVELWVAVDPDDQPLGFIGFNENHVEMLFVDPAHHRQGIGRALLQRVLRHRPHLELACVASKVATFEAMGFQVLAARGPQVLMSTRNYSADGMLAVQDLAPIFQSTEVRQIHAYLLKQHGKRAMSDAEKQRDRLLDQMTQQAQALVRERLIVH